MLTRSPMGKCFANPMSKLEKCGPRRLLRDPPSKPRGPRKADKALVGSANNCTVPDGSTCTCVLIADLSPLNTAGALFRKVMGKALETVVKAKPELQP